MFNKIILIIFALLLLKYFFKNKNNEDNKDNKNDKKIKFIDDKILIYNPEEKPISIKKIKNDISVSKMMNEDFDIEEGFTNGSEYFTQNDNNINGTKQDIRTRIIDGDENYKSAYVFKTNDKDFDDKFIETGYGTCATVTGMRHYFA